MRRATGSTAAAGWSSPTRAPASAPEVATASTRSSELGSPAPSTGRCDIDPLDGIDVAGIEPRNGGVLYQAPVGSAACIDDGRRRRPTSSPPTEGAGDRRGRSAGRACWSTPPSTRARTPRSAPRCWRPRPAPACWCSSPGRWRRGGGERTLVDLVSAGVTRALAQLALAFAVYALWRARRLGRPVAEPQPVAVAGSELVAAVGNLLDRTRSPQPRRRPAAGRPAAVPGRPPGRARRVAPARCSSPSPPSAPASTRPPALGARARARRRRRRARRPGAHHRPHPQEVLAHV